MSDEKPNVSYVLYDAETARADRAEAGYAAWKAWAENVKRILSSPQVVGAFHMAQIHGAPYSGEVITYEILDQPHPGQRFLALARLVEDVDAACGESTVEAVRGEGFIKLADALARLLAWRKEQP